MAKSNFNLSSKRIVIDKANSTVVIVIAATVFVTVFSLVASRVLLGQRAYQSRVIETKQQTLNQLKKNADEVQSLAAAYKEFDDSSQNILGGSKTGTGDRDGSNSRIILDALPSKYDFPGLTTSLDKLVKSNGFILANISGTDDEINQGANETSSTPQPVEIPFSLESNVGANDAKRYMELFERSIRPIQVQKLSVTGQDAQLKITVTAKTYFQPGKNLNLREETIK